jgi:hypothetical protein
MSERIALHPITFQRILDGVTTLAVLAVCILILADAVRSYNRPMPAPAPASIASAPPAPVVGDRLATIAGLDLTASPRTLVLAIQSSCHFCSESMAFYRELAQRHGPSVRLVVVAPDDQTAARRYVTDHGFSPDAIVTSDLLALNVGGTPTLMLAGATGVIEHVWMGKLSAAREQEVLAEVAR